MDSCSSPRASLRGVHLLDLLEHLPRPLLRDSCWPLLPPVDHKSCRLTSRRLLGIAEQLQHEISVHFREDDATDEDVQRLGLCMARHEHLEMLHIKEAADERQTAECLRVSGRACRRVHEVTAIEGTALTGVTGKALARACPAMRTIDVEENDIEPSFFEALGALECLQKVSLHNCDQRPALLHSLASLSALRSLQLFSRQQHFTNECVPHLAALHTLRLCSSSSGGADALLSMGALGILTGLRHLLISAAYVRAETHWALRDAAFNALLARLGTLQSLESLAFCRMSTNVDGTGMTGLRRLTALTSLRVDSITADTPPSTTTYTASGCLLPRLLKLRLESPQEGAQLLGTLRLLLPMDHLAYLRVKLRLGCRAVPAPLDGRPTGEDTSDARATPTAPAGEAALRRAVAHLVKMPQLQRIHLTLVGSCPAASSGESDLFDTTVELQALQPRLGRLALQSCSAVQMSGLTAALSECPHVHTLSLTSCTLEAPSMLHLAQHGHTLRKLHVGYQCPGATPLLAMAVVTARTKPLTLSWADLDRTDMEALRVAVRVLGKSPAVRVVQY